MEQGIDPFRVAAPFDDYSGEVGEFASQLLDGLCAAQEDKPERWQRRDIGTLERWFDLECSLRYMPLPADLHLEHQQLRFHALCDTFHTALPFVDAERNWLLRTYETSTKDGPTRSFNTMPMWIGDQEERIIIAGLRQIVSGRDLMRRWIAWRREADEYSGQGTLGVARDALHGLITLVTPDLPMPDSYLALKS